MWFLITKQQSGRSFWFLSVDSHSFSFLLAFSWKLPLFPSITRPVIGTIVLGFCSGPRCCWFSRTQAVKHCCHGYCCALPGYSASQSWICSTNSNHLHTPRTKLCLYPQSKTGLLYVPVLLRLLWSINALHRFVRRTFNGSKLRLWLFIDSQWRQEEEEETSDTNWSKTQCHPSDGRTSCPHGSRYSKPAPRHSSGTGPWLKLSVVKPSAAID